MEGEDGKTLFMLVSWHQTSPMEGPLYPATCRGHFHCSIASCHILLHTYLGAPTPKRELFMCVGLHEDVGDGIGLGLWRLGFQVKPQPQLFPGLFGSTHSLWPISQVAEVRGRGKHEEYSQPLLLKSWKKGRILI